MILPAVGGGNLGNGADVPWWPFVLLFVLVMALAIFSKWRKK